MAISIIINGCGNTSYEENRYNTEEIADTQENTENAKTDEYNKSDVTDKSEKSESVNSTDINSEAYYFDRFLSDELKINIYDQEISFSELSSLDEIYKTDYLDADNDGINELLLYSYCYCPMKIIDVENGELVILAEGGGTAEFLSASTVDGEVWLCHSDTTHMDEKSYRFVKYNGYKNEVDRFNLLEEYIFHEDGLIETIYTYEDKMITKEQYDELISIYTGNMF